MLGAVFQYPKKYDIQQPPNPRGADTTLLWHNASTVSCWFGQRCFGD